MRADNGRQSVVVFMVSETIDLGVGIIVVVTQNAIQAVSIQGSLTSCQMIVQGSCRGVPFKAFSPKTCPRLHKGLGKTRLYFYY